MLREQKDMGDIIDKKFKILANLSENIHKTNPKRHDDSEFKLITENVAKNR